MTCWSLFAVTDQPLVCLQSIACLWNTQWAPNANPMVSRAILERHTDSAVHVTSTSSKKLWLYVPYLCAAIDWSYKVCWRVMQVTAWAPTDHTLNVAIRFNNNFELMLDVTRSWVRWLNRRDISMEWGPLHPWIVLQEICPIGSTYLNPGLHRFDKMHQPLKEGHKEVDEPQCHYSSHQASSSLVFDEFDPSWDGHIAEKKGNTCRTCT